MYGYHPNAGKVFLIVKEGLKSAAAFLFSNTGITITTDSHNYLRCPLGSKEFIDEFCENLVAKFCHMTNVLCDIAKSYPHEAYSGYKCGLRDK